MNTTVYPTNGKPQRKQLGDQLDRLDTIIDALAEALPEAVADATREGTRLALREVFTEVLGDPELVTRLRAALLPEPLQKSPAGPTPVTTPSRFARLTSAVRNAYQKVVRGVKSAATRAKACLVRTKDRIGTTVTRVTVATRLLKSTLPMRRFLVVAALACVLVTILSYALPHTASALLSGFGGACTTLALQIATWIRRTARSLGLGHS